jgi:hypothetical protein
MSRDDVGGVLGERAELGLALAQLKLGPLALRGVERDGETAGDTAAVVEHRSGDHEMQPALVGRRQFEAAHLAGEHFAPDGVWGRDDTVRQRFLEREAPAGSFDHSQLPIKAQDPHTGHCTRIDAGRVRAAVVRDNWVAPGRHRHGPTIGNPARELKVVRRVTVSIARWRR